MTAAFDVVVIGAGTGGLTAARLLARAGKRVALVERGRPGGDCLWTGCVPTKALLHAAHAAHAARSGARFGVVTAGVSVDMAALRKHIASAQAAAGRPDTPEAIASWGVELVEGEARLLDAHTVEAGGRRLRGRALVIATGSHATLPPIPGLAEAAPDTNAEVFAWERLPATLGVLGGGPIGVEFAQAMCRLGVSVTLVEQLPRLLPREDPAASSVIEEVLRREGVDVRTGTQVVRVYRRPEGFEALFENGDRRERIVCERLLVATGRRPSIEGLGLEAAGVEVTPLGIRVDAALRTSVPHIFAVGDVNGSPQFTHVAEDQARTVARTLAASGKRFARPARWNGRVVPRVTFTDPEVASVGISEEDALRSRRGVRTWEIPLQEVDRALTMGQTDGFLRLVTARGWTRRIPGLAAKVGDEVVGATFVGPSAGDLLMPVVVAMRARLPIGLLAWNMQAYPTLALGVRQVAGRPFTG